MGRLSSILAVGAAGLALLVASGSSTVVAAPACSFEGRDLSSWTAVDYTFRAPSAPKYLYAIRVCGALGQACVADSDQTSVCQMDTSTQPSLNYSVALAPQDGRYSWSYIDSTRPNLGVGYTLQGEKTCWNGASIESYATRVNFICGSASRRPEAVIDGCTTTVTFLSPDACPKTTCTTFNGLDFSSLATRDLVSTTPTNGYTLRVCGNLDAGCVDLKSGVKKVAAACGNGGVLGTFNHSRIPDWKYIDPYNKTYGVQYQLELGELCRPNQSLIARAYLRCAESEGPISMWIPASCIYEYSIPTPLACPLEHPWSVAAHAAESKAESSKSHRHSKSPRRHRAITKILTELF